MEACTMGFALMDLSAPDDAGKGPTMTHQVVNGRLLDPVNITNLAEQLETGGVLNKMPTNAVTVEVSESCVDEASLRDAGAREFVRVMWNAFGPEVTMLLLNGVHRQFLVGSHLMPKRIELLRLMSANLEKLRAIENKSESQMADERVLEQKVQEQRTNNEKLCLWLVRFVSKGDFIYCILFEISQTASEISSIPFRPAGRARSGERGAYALCEQPSRVPAAGLEHRHGSHHFPGVGARCL